MKQSIFAISAFALIAFFTSCEKFELEDHCPEEESYGAVENPQDLRVSDDSDSEESGDSVTSKAFSDEGVSVENSRNNAVGDGGNDDDDSSDDELINDDSDDEDEGEQSHRPGGDSGPGGNSKK